MMYLTLTAIVVLFIAFALIVMNIIESRIRTKENERILWKMEQLDEVSADDFNDRVAEERQNAFKTTLEYAKEALDNKNK